MTKIKLKTNPRIIESSYLSKISGLNVSILDYSCSDVGTHKLYKAKRVVNEAKEKGIEAILFINPVVEDRDNANGSGIDALELACALNYPEAQVISVVHDSRVLWKEPINSAFPNSRQRINLGLDLNKFYNAERLENYFKDLMQGNKGDEEVRDARNYLYSKINPLKCIDGTNFGDIGIYFSLGVRKELKEFDYIIGSAGAGGRALDQITIIKHLDNYNKKQKHIIVIPNGHPLDPFHRYEKSNSPRVQTKFRGKTHEILREESKGREDVIFKSIGMFGGKEAQKAFVNKTIECDGLDMKTSPDGAIGFAILRDRNDLNYANYFTNKGLKIYNSHIACEFGFNYIYENFIPFGSKICIVNTGVSNNNKLRKLIAKGKIK